MSDPIINKISEYDCIGNSLSTINLNYSRLNTWANDIQLKYDNKIKVLLDFYNENIQSINEALTLIGANSAALVSFKTTVQNTSAYWLQPFNVFYPEVLPYPYNNNYNTEISKWLNITYPVQDTINLVTNYVEGENIIVSVHTYIEQVKIDFTKYDSRVTTCYTQNGKVCANCSTYFGGGPVNCHQGTFYCGYTVTCPKCATSSCNYKDPFYNVRGTVGEGLTVYADSKIDANIRMYFKDRWEYEKIKTLQFKVVDCSWTFDKFIS